MGNMISFDCKSCEYESDLYSLGVGMAYMDLIQQYLEDNPDEPNIPNKLKEMHLFECIECGHFGERRCEPNISMNRYGEDQTDIENKRIEKFRCGKCRGKMRLYYFDKPTSSFLLKKPCPECGKKTLYEGMGGCWD